jgi:hypothetical protein
MSELEKYNWLDWSLQPPYLHPDYKSTVKRSPSRPLVPLAQRLSASGHYMSQVALVESYGASKYRAYVAAKGDSTNDLDVYAQAI